MYLYYLPVCDSRKDVIEKTETLAADEMGPPLWRLALCLLLSWIIVVLCLIKGVKSSGKVILKPFYK